MIPLVDPITVDFVLVTGLPLREGGLILLPDVWIEAHKSVGPFPATWNLVRDDGRYVAVYRHPAMKSETPNG